MKCRFGVPLFVACSVLTSSIQSNDIIFTKDQLSRIATTLSLLSNVLEQGVREDYEPKLGHPVIGNTVSQGLISTISVQLGELKKELSVHDAAIISKLGSLETEISAQDLLFCSKIIDIDEGLENFESQLEIISPELSIHDLMICSKILRLESIIDVVTMETVSFCDLALEGLANNLNKIEDLNLDEILDGIAPGLGILARFIQAIS